MNEIRVSNNQGRAFILLISGVVGFLMSIAMGLSFWHTLSIAILAGLIIIFSGMFLGGTWWAIWPDIGSVFLAIAVGHYYQHHHFQLFTQESLWTVGISTGFLLVLKAMGKRKSVT